MEAKLENHDEESFIILGTSPGTSLDMKCNGIENGYASLDKVQLADAMKELPVEASMAFKAHFKLGDCPSPASMMVASTIISDDKSTQDLQKRFGEILDENVILKETLKQNNDSLKEQFMLIASCQEDMMKTHTIHKEKFEETRELVEKLRQENKKLKLDLSRLAESEGPQSVKSDSSGVKTGPSSAVEFVTSPDDDTINKLTSQLELVEKQRRQVIVDNEKLTWQKESLEHIVDATSKERDDLREKLKKAELQVSSKDSEYSEKISRLNYTIQDLSNKLQSADSVTSVSSDEIVKRDKLIQQLETKVTALQADLKVAQLKILDLENVKLEFTKYKSGVLDMTKLNKEQTQELQSRLKEAQTTMFQPVRLSLDAGAAPSADQDKLAYNVKLYDKTLKHLAQLLNMLTHGLSDSLVQTLGAVASLHDYKLEKTTVENFKGALAEVKQQLEKEHSAALNNIGQVKGTLSIFEGIFKDHEQLFKTAMSKQDAKPSDSPNVEALTAALVARGQELQSMETQLNVLKADREDMDLLKAQLDIYKSDFEAERELREKMASEKESILANLRTEQKRNLDLTKQLEEVRRLNPSVSKNVFSRRVSSSNTPTRQPSAPAPAPATTSPSTTGNMVYTCPKCMRFSCDQYKVMEDHFDFCLDDF